MSLSVVVQAPEYDTSRPVNCIIHVAVQISPESLQFTFSICSGKIVEKLKSGSSNHTHVDPLKYSVNIDQLLASHIETLHDLGLRVQIDLPKSALFLAFSKTLPT